MTPVQLFVNIIVYGIAAIAGLSALCVFAVACAVAVGVAAKKLGEKND